MKIEAEKESLTQLELFVISAKILLLTDDENSAVGIGRKQALQLANALRYFHDTGKLPE